MSVTILEEGQEKAVKFYEKSDSRTILEIRSWIFFHLYELLVHLIRLFYVETILFIDDRFVELLFTGLYTVYKIRLP